MNPAFPASAEPVRAKIRELVGRPVELPSLLDGEGPLGWGIRCPWLLVPIVEAIDSEVDGLWCFFDWWDACTEAQEAVATVWGEG